MTISGPDGYIYDRDGISGEKLDYMLEMRASGRDRAQDYAEKFGVPFFAGKKPWSVPADIRMPCAVQNEIGPAEAEDIVGSGAKYYIEVANMPTTGEALAYIKGHGIPVAPSKAVNAGGVAVSALEMEQNSMRCSWSAEKVDAKLQEIMKTIYASSCEAAAEYGFEGDLVRGANIAGFLRVAQAMLDQGVAY